MSDFIKKFINKAKSIFRKDDRKCIFSHVVLGESCAVCGEGMHTSQGIIMVGAGDKMHSDCWPKYMDNRPTTTPEEAVVEFDTTPNQYESLRGATNSDTPLNDKEEALMRC
ncbi:MAG: hypothetical protein GY861_04665 [bacterium]|nr:hypothetical protein [bacterium]